MSLITFALGMLSGICLTATGAILGAISFEVFRERWVRYRYRKAYRRFLARIPLNIRAELSPGSVDCVVMDPLWDATPCAKTVVKRRQRT